MNILLADDQPEVRRALTILLEQQPGLTVVGEAVDAHDLLAQIETTCPDMLLLDWELPGMAGIELLSALRRVCPDLLVIALSGRPGTRRAALAAGASAFVSKADPPDRLLAAIQRVGIGSNDSETRSSLRADILADYPS
ncbi:MAG: response regulator transcription factor [Chloroflexota bacterium]